MLPHKERKALQEEEKNAPPFTFEDALATAREMVAEHAPPKKRHGRRPMTRKELETVKTNVITALEAHGPLYATYLRGKVPHSKKTIDRALKSLEHSRRSRRVVQNEDGRWALTWMKSPLPKKAK
jgi:hypothetical protein